jgi:hypothetical protein
MARTITAETRFNEIAFNPQTVVRGINAAIALQSLAAIGKPVVALFAKIGAVLEKQAEARRARREDERLWNVALSDARVMADLSRAMSRDAARDVRGYY